MRIGYNAAMRTTINIDDGLLQAVRAMAAARGLCLGDVIDDALREMLDRRRRQEGETAQETAMPISRVKGAGLRPGLDLADTSGLIDALDGLR